MLCRIGLDHSSERYHALVSLTSGGDKDLTLLKPLSYLILREQSKDECK